MRVHAATVSTAAPDSCPPRPQTRMELKAARQEIAATLGGADGAAAAIQQANDAAASIKASWKEAVMRGIFSSCGAPCEPLTTVWLQVAEQQQLRAQLAAQSSAAESLASDRAAEKDAGVERLTARLAASVAKADEAETKLNAASAELDRRQQEGDVKDEHIARLKTQLESAEVCAWTVLPPSCQGG